MSTSSPHSQPLISVVLPTYNGARYLAESIESCLRQTYQHWELIVVDDASTDKTPEIIQRFALDDARILCVRHEKNRRLPAGLNSGFRVASGDYLTWTSDDNRFLPRALEEMVGTLQREPSAAVVYSDFDVIDDSGQKTASQAAAEPEKVPFGGNMIPSFLFRRQVFEQVGPYAEDFFLAEDYDYWLRILAAGCRMLPLHEVLYEYRLHSASLTDVHKGRTFRAAELALLRRLGALSIVDRRNLGRGYLYLASLASWQHARGRAVGYTLRAMNAAPRETLAKFAELAAKRVKRQ